MDRREVGLMDRREVVIPTLSDNGTIPSVMGPPTTKTLYVVSILCQEEGEKEQEALLGRRLGVDTLLL
jgi:hypothetical protein